MARINTLTGGGGGTTIDEDSGFSSSDDNGDNRSSTKENFERLQDETSSSSTGGGGSRSTTLDSGTSGGSSSGGSSSSTARPSGGGGSTGTRGGTTDDDSGSSGRQTQPNVPVDVDERAQEAVDEGRTATQSGDSGGAKSRLQDEINDLLDRADPSQSPIGEPSSTGYTDRRADAAPGTDTGGKSTSGTRGGPSESTTPGRTRGAGGGSGGGSGGGASIVDDFTMTEAKDETLTEATDETPDDVDYTSGVLTEEQERAIRQKTAEVSQTLNYEEEVESVANPVVGPRVGGFLGGFGRLPGTAAQAVGGAVNLTESAFEASESASRGEVTGGEVLSATAGAAGEAGRQTVKEVKEDPASALGELVGGLVIGSAAVRGVEKASSVGRSAKTVARSDTRVDADELADEGRVGQTVGSDNPEFSQQAVADTDTAVKELQDAASDAPDEVQELAGGDEVLIHGTDQGRFPDTGDVTPGDRSEVAGQFFAGDLSRLRLGGGRSGGLSSIKPRKPSLTDKREAVLTNPKNIDAVPDRLGGSRTPGEDLDAPVTDTDLLGRKKTVGRETGDVSDYMIEEGGSGEAFIMPRGTRTPEQEAVIPENTPFTATGDTVAIRMGMGDYIPGRVYRYGDPDADAPSSSRIGAGDTVIAADLPTSQVTRPQGTPVGPPLGGLPGTTPTPDVSDTPSPTSGGPTSGGPTTGGPTSGGPTSGGPTSGGPTSGGPTTGGPTSGGPTSGGPTSGGPTSGGPTSGGPTSGGPSSGGPSDFGSPYSPSGSGSGGPSGSSAGTPTGSGPSGSGSSTGGYPFDPTPPSSPGRPFDLPEFDSGDGEEVAAELDPERGERFTAFINPLTGERL